LSRFSALVLAGARPGSDPVAQYAGVGHKGLITLAGETLLSRVVKALAAAGAQSIGVSTADPAVLAALQTLQVEAEILPLPATSSLSLSVRQGLEAMGAPLLVTTVDHALLRPEWVTQFLGDTPAEADIAVLLAPKAAVLAAAPDTVRTYLKFRDGLYSGCNLFYLRTERALAAVDLWRRVEAYRKQPWRIAALLGPMTLMRYGLGRLTLDEAVSRLGDAVGVRARAVHSPYGLCAVDVDKPSDLDLVRRLSEA
jgi:CTP:molybdopterin cytidylyltransferase MocA